MLSKLPWTPRPALVKPRQRKLKREQRDALITAMAKMLRNAEPTCFAREGYCTHGLRAGLVLQGWGWELANVTAHNVVKDALNRVGAKRPSWIEAQANFAQGGALVLCEHCWQCGKLLLGATDVKYCSGSCRQQFHSQVARIWVREGGDAYRSATRKTRGLDVQHNA